MSEAEVQRIQERFEGMFREGVTPWTEHGLEPAIPAFADAVQREVSRPRVLDIGCGNGWVSLYLAARGIAGVGLDSSMTAIDEARRTAREQGLADLTQFDVGDGLALPYEDASFDAVFDRGFFHHVPEDEYQRYLSEVTRVMRPGGLFSLHAFSTRNQRMRHEFRADDIIRIFGSHFAVLESEEDPWPNDAPAHLGHYLLRKR
jgi:ubiquinone/menaquinone biosynthesis C-methylase UbiE